MSFCDLVFKRKDNSIEVKNNKGEKSPLYNSLLQYTSTNDVYTGREWFFDRLVQQSKLKSTNPSELALGLYSIAFNSGKSESYWLNKIDQLLPTKSNVVDYKIKAVEILQSDKAYQMFEKGKKNNWSLDKILSELMVPKDQKELIKEVQSEMSYYDEIPFNEQLATELVSKYSFGVEINTTKTYDDVKMLMKREDLSYEEALQYSKSNSKSNTSFYSNLTVPGGTNYTENEISTPLITPSIKGHAQFATDNGIGWFRSDEQSINQRERKQDPTEDEFFNENDLFIGGDLTKTRRIIEVQSDLFQKGRDVKNLTTIKEEGKIENFIYKDLLYSIEYTPTGVGQFLQIEYLRDGENISEQDYYQAKENYLNEVYTAKENSFLQLLNKNNNWVSFFVKSIIQDSFKKGYEKVLFPSGNTASKIEGHTTLEEFKREKESRLKQLVEEKEKYLTKTSFKRHDIFASADYRDDVFIVNGNRTTKEKFEEFKQLGITDYDREIAQLQKELEDVEGSQGFGALKPIYKFYEETVTNILNNLYKNRVTRITDEYGNTWNEVSLYESNTYSNPLVIDRSVVIDNNAKQSLLQPSELRQEMFNNWRDYYNGYDDLSDEEKIQFIELVESGLLEIQCKI